MKGNIAPIKMTQLILAVIGMVIVIGAMIAVFNDGQLALSTCGSGLSNALGVTLC